MVHGAAVVGAAVIGRGRFAARRLVGAGLRAASLGAVVAVCLVALWSGSALAAPVDVASDHVALHAVDRYFRGQVSKGRAGRQSDDAFVASISASCPNVLAPLAVLPPSSVSSNAVFAFGEEVGGDLGLRAAAPNLVPLAKMAKVLSKLRWSSPSTVATVTRFVAAERALFSLAPSSLCADAAELVGAPKATPAGTLRWLANFARHGTADATLGGAFLNILGRFHTSADNAVIKDITAVAQRYATARTALLHAEVPKLLGALGLPT